MIAVHSVYLKGGGCLSTMKDVARVAGVSIATVSRVLAGTAAVTDSTQKKVLAAMEELQYRTAAPGPARDPEGEPTHRRMHGKSHIAVLHRPAARASRTC